MKRANIFLIVVFLLLSVHTVQAQTDTTYRGSPAYIPPSNPNFTNPSDPNYGNPNSLNQDDRYRHDGNSATTPGVAIPFRAANKNKNVPPASSGTSEPFYTAPPKDSVEYKIP